MLTQQTNGQVQLVKVEKKQATNNNMTRTASRQHKKQSNTVYFNQTSTLKQKSKYYTYILQGINLNP